MAAKRELSSTYQQDMLLTFGEAYAKGKLSLYEYHMLTIKAEIRDHWRVLRDAHEAKNQRRN